MKTTNELLKNARIICLSLWCAGLLLFTGCEDATIDGPNESNVDPNTPPAAVQQLTASSDEVPESNLAARMADEALPAVGEESARTSGATTYINFQDEEACTWNPNICTNTFVTWPGYIQNTGYGEWGYAWMSNGPGTSFISYGTSSHYHIVGLSMPEVQPNPAHTAMFGSDWFAFYMQRSGSGRINFDLTQIKVNGTVPITLWFKTASGNWLYWPSLGPGRWNLPGASSIREFHVRAASRASGDKYSIDDIRVKGL